MALNLSLPEEQDLKPRITVFGVGGAGGNAVNNMIEKSLEGTEFVVANTDAQALQQSAAKSRIQLGVQVTQGLGAGAKPEIGARAAEESIEEIVDHLAGAHMCFITAGMGGGTGTGAAPIIAKAARELGILTVGVVTKPFQFEGARRMKSAEAGVAELQKVVDTLIIIPNQNLFRLANEKTTFTEAFSLADDVLYQGVKGVTDLMVRPGIINLDFADVRAVMDEMGKAMMGTGEAEGDDRAVQAAEAAIANPLLDEISLKGAKGVLINVTGGTDLTLFELDEAANRIRAEVDPDANIIVGSTLDDSMSGRIRVSVVATGIDAEAREGHNDFDARPTPAELRKSAPGQAAPLAASASHMEAGETEEAAHSAAPVIAAAMASAGVQTMRPSHYTLNEEQNLFTTEEELPPAETFVDHQAQTERAVEAVQAAPAPAPVAEQPRRPGDPSPEALRRLAAAVAKVPEGGSMHRNHAPAPAAKPAAEDHGHGNQTRFAINSLIHRMTGQGERPSHAAEPTASRPQPAHNEEQERVDIPAFLRRQAN